MSRGLGCDGSFGHTGFFRPWNRHCLLRRVGMAVSDARFVLMLSLSVSLAVFDFLVSERERTRGNLRDQKV